MNRAVDEPCHLVRRLPWDAAHASREILLEREWIVTNALGGYASGTISGAVTRRYHGLLIAALPVPHGRMVMWSHVSEFLCFGDDDIVSLGSEERAGGQLDLRSAEYLREFIPPCSSDMVSSSRSKTGGVPMACSAAAPMFGAVSAAPTASDVARKSRRVVSFPIVREL